MPPRGPPETVRSGNEGRLPRPTAALTAPGVGVGGACQQLGARPNVANRGLVSCMRLWMCDTVRASGPPPPHPPGGKVSFTGLSSRSLGISAPLCPASSSMTGHEDRPSGRRETQAGPPNLPHLVGAPSVGSSSTSSPQLPEGDVLIEPQTVVAFLLGHVAPLLPVSTGDRRGLRNAAASPASRPPALIYRGHPRVASLTPSGEHLP